MVIPFPLKFHLDVEKITRWKNLTQWMKLQLVVMLLSEWEESLITFNINLHPDLEAQWVAEGKDPIKMMRDRARTEIRKVVGKNWEYFFVVEGESRRGGKARLHYHGGIRVLDTSNQQELVKALGRAAGHGLRGYRKDKRAIFIRPFHGEEDYWPNYILKSIYVADPRLSSRRLVLSRSLVQAGHAFWDWIARG